MPWMSYSPAHAPAPLVVACRRTNRHHEVTAITVILGNILISNIMMTSFMNIRIIRISATIAFASALFMAAAAAAEPVGFVMEALLATPEADTPIYPDTKIDIEDMGHILIIMRSGQLFRQDGPFHGQAASLLDKIETPSDDDVGNGVLSSLLELTEVSRKSTEQRGGVRGVERMNDVHPNAITAATRTYCFVKGVPPGFHASMPPRRDEPLMLRLRASPKGFFQATWPVGVKDLPWPADWPEPVEGRYIWSVGGQGPAPLWLRAVEALPDSLVERTALYYDMRCYTQAIALIRQIMASAERF